MGEGALWHGAGTPYGLGTAGGHLRHNPRAHSCRADHRRSREFRDPQTQRFQIDFAEYMQVCLAEYLQQCARIVKEETGGKKIAVFFYGYLYDVSGFHYGAAVSGHLRLRQVLDCKDIDIVCSPISYFDRGAGGVGPSCRPSTRSRLTEDVDQRGRCAHPPR